MFLFCLSNWRASPQWYRGCTLTMPQLSGRLPHNSGSFSPLVCRQWDLLPALACCESPLILVGWLHVRRCGLSNAFCVSAQNGVHQSKKWLQQVLYQDLWSSLFEQTSLSCRFYSSCFLAFALSISSALIIGFLIYVTHGIRNLFYTSCIVHIAHELIFVWICWWTSVWSSVGSHQYCIWNIRSHTSRHWSWCRSNLCSAS